MSASRIRLSIAALLACFSFFSLAAYAADPGDSTATTKNDNLAKSSDTATEPPTDWIDPQTGHRVIRLTREPDSATLYFHQNGFADRGDKLFFTITPPRPRGQRGQSATSSAGDKKTDDHAGNKTDNKTADNKPPDSANANANQPQDADPALPRGARNRGLFFPSITMATLDLTTLGVSPPKIDKIAEGFYSGSHVIGKKTRSVYYTRFDVVEGVRVWKAYCTNLDTHETREIGTLPYGRPGSGLAINADETLLGGSFVDLPPLPIGSSPSPRGEGRAEGAAQSNSDGKSIGTSAENARPGAGEGGFFSGPTEDRSSQEDRLAQRLAQKLPMKLYTIDIKSGEVKTFAPSTQWLNHVQFSPTDPKLMLYCHEGPWHLVDRIWTINVDGGEPKLMHHRSMPYEIAGHEFPSFDGRTEWYDLQTPRSGQFWLAGVNLDTGERIRYSVDRPNWSVHYNQSRDGKLFAGDGGGPNSVANRTPLPENKLLDPPGNGQWIYLFHPRAEYETLKIDGEDVKVGKFDAEKLVDLSKHDYSLEPNLTFSPDNKWIIFRSNMYGPTHVYAVEIAKTSSPPDRGP